MRKNVVLAVWCGFALALGCGGSGADPDLDPDDEDDGNDGDVGDVVDGSVFPVGFAVASPLSQSIVGNRTGVQVQALTNVTPGKSFAQKQEELAALLAGTSAEDCALRLPTSVGSFSPLCYGPSLDYENHPDSPDGTQSGQLPSGDLGIWEATQGESEPCAAAKLSSLVNNVGDKVDYGLYMAASMVCLMNVNGVEMPAEGESQELTELVHASVAANNPGFTVNGASIARLADDASGAAVYAYSVNIDVLDIGPQGENEITVDTVLEHVFDAASPGSYHGTVRGTVDPFGMREREAYSVVYERTGDHLRYGLRLASYEDEPVAVFDEDGQIDLGGDWIGNMNQGIFDLDAEHGTFGNASFGWQAGRQDSYARVFNVWVDGDEAGKSGCGFFGFGPRFDAEAGTAPDNSISTFICNWAGPGGEHGGRTGYAQKQCFESEAGSPLVMTDSRIAYAPVNDCDTTDDPDFRYKVLDSDDWLNEQIPDELIELASDPDFASYAPPTAPAGF